jgi:tetratricopeptide (TPR) repeat protein
MKITSVVILFLLFSCQEAAKQESPWRPDTYLAARYNDTAVAYSDSGKYELALVYHNKAILYDSTCAGYFHNRGYAKRSLKRYQEALEDFTMAIEIESDTLCQDRAESYNSRAITFKEMKDYSSAIKDYTRAISLDTSRTEYLLYRGEVYIAMGDTLNACADWQKVWDKGGEAGLSYLIEHCRK